MNWRDTIIAALDPAKVIDVIDERDLGSDALDYRAAAVLIAITDRPDPGVILTLRPEWLRNHGGQVAFPGGKIDAGDASAVAAALREAHEEIALPRAQVDVLGEADLYCSGSGYCIMPIIGVIPPDLPLQPNPDEVEDVFEVPFEFLLNPANAQRRTAFWNGQDRQYYDMDWQGRRIWGITAGIIANLARRING